MWYYVEYNGRCLKAKKSLQPCLEFIKSKGLKGDLDNTLAIYDAEGHLYDPCSGHMVDPFGDLM